MSVHTTWDEQRDRLEQSLKDAKSTLVVLINPDTWGYEDIRQDKIEMYEELYIELTKIIRKINS